MASDENYDGLEERGGRTRSVVALVFSLGVQVINEWCCCFRSFAVQCSTREMDGAPKWFLRAYS